MLGGQPLIITTPPASSPPNNSFGNNGSNRNALIDQPEQTPSGVSAQAMELGSVSGNTRATVPSAGPASSEPFKEHLSLDDPAPTKPVQRSFFSTLMSKLSGRGLVLPQNSSRVIPINASRTTPLIQPETGKPFVSNSVTTARYNLWDFLPKQLYAQFSKIANVYFLFVASLQMVPSWSPTGQYTTLVPLLVFLSIAMAHEGYDDWRRHRQDSGENNQAANVFRSYRNATNSISSPPQQQPNSPFPLSASASSRHAFNAGGSGDGSVSPSELSITIPLTPAAYSPSPQLAVFQKIKWKDLAVGDIVRVDQNDWIPADLVLLHSSGHEGGCFVETAALDGETNLKQRQSLRVTNDIIRTPEDLVAFSGKNYTTLLRQKKKKA